MVRLGAYCIDQTEVTNAQYAEFAYADERGFRHHPACGFNGTYVPSKESSDHLCPSAFDPAGKPDHPVGCVDWCDAHDYCAWAGKRLCGKIGGGPTPFAAAADRNASEWTSACSGGGATLYPYGNQYDPVACNGWDCPDVRLLAVGSASGCHGTMPPYDRIFDMVGNSWEWDDSCEADVGGSDKCRMRGGSAQKHPVPASSVWCDYEGVTDRDNDIFFDIGFRCCSDIVVDGDAGPADGGNVADANSI